MESGGGLFVCLVYLLRHCAAAASFRLRSLLYDGFLNDFVCIPRAQRFGDELGISRRRVSIRCS